MLRFWLAFACLALGGTSCSDTGASCTEVGCSNEAVVTFPGGLVSGPYNLTLQNSGGSETYACNDPQTAAELPPEVDCNAGGFELTDSDFGSRSTVTVTLTDADENLIAGPAEVVLQAVETLQPNGPDCDPTCVIRNGRLLVN